MNGTGVPVVEKDYQFPKTLQPPSIEILSKVLNEGKNVIRLNITSEIWTRTFGIEMLIIHFLSLNKNS
jgi:hypothetical protein